jgi:hypothetical protein
MKMSRKSVHARIDTENITTKMCPCTSHREYNTTENFEGLCIMWIVPEGRVSMHLFTLKHVLALLSDIVKESHYLLDTIMGG